MIQVCHYRPDLNQLTNRCIIYTYLIRTDCRLGSDYACTKKPCNHCCISLLHASAICFTVGVMPLGPPTKPPKLPLRAGTHNFVLYHLTSEDCNNLPIQVVRRGSPRGAALYMIVFRPAASDKLDKGMVNISIPAITTRATDQNPTAFYFGCIHKVQLSPRAIIARVFTTHIHRHRLWRVLEYSMENQFDGGIPVGVDVVTCEGGERLRQGADLYKLQALSSCT